MASVEAAEAAQEDTERWRAFVRDGEIEVNYSFERIPFGQLFVDYHESVLNGDEVPQGSQVLAYQRRQNKYAQKMLKEGVKPDLFGTLIVNRRPEGTFAVVDGGTRFRALQMLGTPVDVLVPCLVYEWDPLEEIGNYVSLNKERSGLTQVDFFAARVKYGEEVAVAIDEILRAESGHTIANGKGDWQAVAAIEDAHRRENLADTVSIMRQLGWIDKPRGKTQAMVAGISRIRQQDTFDEEWAIKRWKGVTPVELFGEAQEWAKASPPGQSRSLARTIALALITRYNKGVRSSGKKLDPSPFIINVQYLDDED